MLGDDAVNVLLDEMVTLRCIIYVIKIKTAFPAMLQQNL